MGARERFAEFVRYQAEMWMRDYGPRPPMVPSAKPEFAKADPFDPLPGA